MSLSDDSNLEGWVGQKRILVILAHPDDPEFFCGGMIARWIDKGHQVSYCLLTKGQRGFQEKNLNVILMADIRIQEQLEAAAKLGVKEVKFLEHMDGELVADIALREEIIKEIRTVKPDVVVSCDPTNLFPAENRINHPDHRAAGQAVLDAVFPAAGNPGYQFPRDPASNEPHQVQEVWLTVAKQPNFTITLTSYLDQKIAALLCHRSQVHVSAAALRERYLGQYAGNDENELKEYSERFLRIVFS